MTLEFLAGTTLKGSPVPLLASGGISIDLDITFVAQMVIFGLLVVLLKPLLFDPVLKIFEEREKRTDGAKAQARKMQEKAGKLLRKYEREMEKVHRVAAEEREKLRAETARLEAEILEEARTVTSQIVEDGRRQAQEEANRIQFDLGKQAAQISGMIVTRLLGKGASS